MFTHQEGQKTSMSSETNILGGWQDFVAIRWRPVRCMRTKAIEMNDSDSVSDALG